jgi:hypothetical protein
MMKRLSVLAAAGLLAAVVGCKKGGDDANDKFDRIMARLDAMDRKIDQIAQGRGGAARPPSPAEPDPRTTYSIPVTADDFPKGPATAKVTIVEAADFA